MLRLSGDVDFSTMDWSNQAFKTRRHAEALPPGPKRNAEIDRALAREALALEHSGNLLLQLKQTERLALTAFTELGPKLGTEGDPNRNRDAGPQKTARQAVFRMELLFPMELVPENQRGIPCSQPSNELCIPTG